MEVLPVTNEHNPEISIVIPVYNGRSILPVLVERLEAAMTQINVSRYEIVLVDDCAPDNAWPAIEEASRRNPRFKGVRLMRNFGQHPAILAGLNIARGKFVVVMDCDLQDDPAAIPELYKRITSSGKDAVIVRGTNKRGGFFRWLTSRVFYATFNRLAGVRMERGIGNFGIYTGRLREIIVEEFSDTFFYFPCFVHWLGIDTDYLDYDCSDRYDGKSGYSFRKRLMLAAAIIVSFSAIPLYYVIIFGIGFLSLSALTILALVVGHFQNWFSVPGWVSVICTLFLCTSIIVIFMGVTGFYIAKIFEQTKMRPRFLIRRTSP